MTEETLWLDMLESRNLTSHDYGRELSENIADKISTRYAKALQNLYKFLSEHMNRQ